MAVFDATALIHLFEPKAAAAIDPDTGQPVTHAKERIDHLVASLEQARRKIVIPTPALSEVLVYAGSATADYLKVLHGSSAFRVVPFDERAAIELAVLTHDALVGGTYHIGAVSTRATLKFRSADTRHRPC